MKQYLVERPNGNVAVAILRNKSDNTYSYVNLTKGHICSCRFVSEEEAFKNFRNFQGFIEEIYNCIPDKEKNNYTTSWNWGDDEIFNPEGDSHMTHQVDLGNFRAWSTNNQCWLYRTGSDPTATYHPNSDGNAKFKHSLWPHAWYCIRLSLIHI